jgi:hypothetical protein
MWAQLVKFRIKEGNEDRLQQLDERWNNEVGRGTDSGWVRSLVLQSTKDPRDWYELVYFESEEKARANERSEKHQALVTEMQQLSESIDFVDLAPVKDSSR